MHFSSGKNLTRKGSPFGKLAEKTFSSRPTIIASLRWFNITLRLEDEQRKLTPGQLRYGERLVKGRVVRHKGELAAIERMVKLRLKGASYCDIAAILQADGLRTKYGKRWHPTTVMKILKTQ